MPKSKKRAQRDGSVASEIDNSAERHTRAEPSTDKAEEFAQLLVYALSNAEVARKLKVALGVCEQLDSIQQELEALRKAMKVKDDAILELKKEVVTLRSEHDDLEQYTRRNSIRLTGLTETKDENVYDTVMAVLNEEMGVSPPISADEIDRIHRVGKPDQTQRRSILIKFATYRSKKRVVVNRRYLNPLKRAERDRAQTPGNHSSDDNRRATTAPTDRRLYINDDLTKYRQQLLYRCSQEKKANKIADCWSTDGTILVKTIKHKIAVVRNATELEHMCV